jgi:hypothetical protein
MCRISSKSDASEIVDVIKLMGNRQAARQQRDALLPGIDLAVLKPL